MPKDFERCRDNGGRVRTISGPDKQFDLSKGEYRHVCFLRGSAYWGEKHTRKNNSQEGR